MRFYPVRETLSLLESGQKNCPRNSCSDWAVDTMRTSGSLSLPVNRPSGECCSPLTQMPWMKRSAPGQPARQKEMPSLWMERPSREPGDPMGSLCICWHLLHKKGVVLSQQEVDGKTETRTITTADANTPHVARTTQRSDKRHYRASVSG